MAANGGFVWYELMTTDPQGAKAFYSDVLGWKLASSQGGNYEMWQVGDRQVGGLMQLPEMARKAGAPPHWLGYVWVDSVDTTAEQAQRLGGRVMMPGTDIPNVGRFAVLADPQGAVFAVFSSPQEMGGPQGPGPIAWHELNTTDFKAAWSFYSELFGWKNTDTMNMGPELGDYFMFDVANGNGMSMGGMSNAAKMMNAPPHWLYYAAVDALEPAVERIKKGGGKILNGPMEVPGGGRIVQAQDPQGGYFALFSMK